MQRPSRARDRGQIAAGIFAFALFAATHEGARAESAAAVVAGAYHTCVLTDAGGVRCFGGGGFGEIGDGVFVPSPEPVSVVGLSSGVATLAATSIHTCALTTAGGVACWGYNSQGQLGNGTTEPSSVPVSVTGLSSDVVAIAAGIRHTCALTSAGGVVCWGSNFRGELGNGSNADSSVPVPVSGLASGGVAIAAGEFSTCAITTGGSVRCWGANSWGQLGDGTRVHRNTPVAVNGLSGGAEQISIGTNHTCAVTTGGRAECWGANHEGQLGDDALTHSETPLTVAGLESGVDAIGAGAAFTCALTQQGAVRCLGWNEYGQLGDGTTVGRSEPATAIGLASGVASIAAGTYHACATTTNGAVVCWGENGFGQTGDGRGLFARVPTPISEEPASALASIDAGGAHTCASTIGGGGWCWGANSNGELGNGTTTDSSVPVPVTGLASGLAAIAVGDEQYTNHTCGLTTSGSVLCWGFNSSGQLGNGTNASSSVPVAVSGLGSDAAAIALGNAHTCAVTRSGEARCWGANGYGQLGNPSVWQSSVPLPVTGLSSGVSAIALGAHHTCALRGAGEVLCWGENEWGQLGNGGTDDRMVPTPVSGLASEAVAIAAAWNHTCALLTGGGVQCWGHNFSGELGNGTTVNSSVPVTVSGLSGPAVRLAAGSSRTCASMSDGRLECWGYNSSWTLGSLTIEYSAVPIPMPGLSGVSAISLGREHTCALTSDGGKCWGSNLTGQLGNGHQRVVPVPTTAIGFSGAAPIPGLSGAGWIALAMAVLATSLRGRVAGAPPLTAHRASK